jgi:hypothetical protein
MTSSETAGSKDLSEKMKVHFGENVLCQGGNIKFCGSANKNCTPFDFFLAKLSPSTVI